MKRKALWTAVAVVLLAAVAFGQTQEQYLDVYIAQVKPEKRADFDAINKKMAAANRQNKGDSWIAMETVYGRGDRVTFISMRDSYADADKGSQMFEQALQKTYGKAAADKMGQDFEQCVASVRTEYRRRRWDLSSNAPADAAAMAKMLGNARWLRTTAVHVKPGQVAAFEALLKDLKTAREKASPPLTALVSQAVAGQEGTVFYVTSLQTSMAGFDAIPTTQQLLGEEGYAKFLKTSADVVENTETVINRFLPELSNAPEEVVAAAPDYWRPKATMAAKASPAKSTVVNATETGKVDDKNKH
jgi:antibiotic biosynthesis monooxygenase (ABM) superfamily enzyme